MRTPRRALFVFFFLCSVSAFCQDHCLNISPIINGNITFQVNKLRPGKTPYENFPTWYRVKIYKDHTLVKKLRIKRHTDAGDTFVIDPKEADRYCIQVRENLAVGVLFRTIGWSEQHNHTASLSASIPVRPPISSLDGKKGDGIQVLID